VDIKMDILKLKSVKGRVAGLESRDTSMSPQICNTDDGDYIVKFVENQQGPRGLINEYVCYELAKILELPIPDAAFVEIEDGLEFEIEIRKKEITKVESNLAFGSKFLENVNAVLTEGMVVECVNKEKFLSILLFDHIIENQDRDKNYGNLLMNRDNKIILVIDHERVFGAGNIWDQYTCYQRLGDDSKLLNFDEDSVYTWMRRNCDLTSYTKETLEVFEKVDSDTIDLIIEGIPDDWNCSKDDSNALRIYLKDRFKRVNKLVDMIINM
jgi:hypothetical protein